MSGGRTCYFGPVQDVETYFRGVGYPIPGNTNPAEFLLDIISSDFSSGRESSLERVEAIQHAWATSTEADALTRHISERVQLTKEDINRVGMGDMVRPGPVQITTALLHRSFIKSYRDVVAYGIRIVMYLGMCYRNMTPYQYLTWLQD